MAPDLNVHPNPDKIELLKSTQLFKDTDPGILRELAPLLQEVIVKKGDVVFSEDEIGDCLYIIGKGRMEIKKNNVTLAILEEKEVVGELALLDTEKRSATALAYEDCILYKIEQEPFYKVFHESADVARGFIRILCNRLRIMNEKSSKG